MPPASEIFLNTSNVTLGWNYVREDRGNDVLALVEALSAALEREGPQVLHIRTQRPNLEPPKRYTPGTTFQWWAAQTMQRLFDQDETLCLLSPAMLSGGGFSTLARQFPRRVIDTGINEGHCVAMAAGMAAAGGRPWVHIYSTFLQRAYDQVVHDVGLQSLPVVFLVDRAGLVGADGPTHHGVFDLGFLMDIPGLTVWNPKDGDELAGMLECAAKEPLAGPLAIRYPKSTTVFEQPQPFEPWRFVRHWGSNTVLVSTGALSAHQGDLGIDHIHVAQTAPLDARFLAELKRYEQVLVFEETTGHGGLTGALHEALCNMDRVVKMVVRKLPMDFVAHGSRSELLRQYGLIPRQKEL